MVRSIAILVLGLLVPFAHAQVDQDALEEAQSRIHASMVAMQLGEAQREPFTELAQGMIADVRAEVARGVRRNQSPARIARKIRQAFADADEPARAVLTESQWPAWQWYKYSVSEYMRMLGDFGPDARRRDPRPPEGDPAPYRLEEPAP